MNTIRKLRLERNLKQSDFAQIEEAHKVRY